MNRARSVFAASFLTLALASCAEAVRQSAEAVRQPAELPFHRTDHEFFDVHWRLDRESNRVTASGVVEAARQGNIKRVILELRGIDRGGRVVSRALGYTYGPPLMRWDTRPFAVRLRPTGAEERFELSVWSWDWDFGGAPGGS